MDNKPKIRATSSQLSFADHWDHFLARWGVNRMGHRVEPGLYAVGSPGPESPVFVTANYSLSFDALRSNLAEIDGYILVLDTRGINVWCAAGKGTFGTEELVGRIEATGLGQVVEHRTLILPQLGGPGVAAHLVKKGSGFKVEYGPVRASDLPAYMRTRQATPEMRRVRFDLLDRVVLIPVELVSVLLPALVAALVLYFIAGPLAAGAVLTASVGGTILFPILLPWLPGRDFSLKGLILGGILALPFMAASLLTGSFPSGNLPPWVPAAGVGSYLQVLVILRTLAYPLVMAPITAYLALNFTGASTFTSKTGVEREMSSYIRPMAGTFGAGLVLTVLLVAVGWLTQK